MVHCHVTFLVYEVNLQLQYLKYCEDLFSGVIFRYHILMNFCTYDRILHYLYLSYNVAVVSRFIRKIVVQAK